VLKIWPSAGTPQSVVLSKMATKRKSAQKRTLIKPKGDARYIRRDSGGRIKESDDVGRSLRQDRRKKARRTVPAGQGDRGDQKRRSS
jgi:hypothetical protein